MMWILHFVLFQDYFGYFGSLEIPYEFDFSFLQKEKKHILGISLVILIESKCWFG